MPTATVPSRPTSWRSASMALRLLDQNDDETISLAEQAPFRDPVIAGTVISHAEDRRRAAGLLADAARPGRGHAPGRAQVLNRYDSGGPEARRPRDHRLSRTEIGLPAEVFAAYDGNDDETLDRDELGEYLDALEPSVELIVRLGPSVPGHSRVEVVTTAGSTIAPGVPRCARPAEWTTTLTTLDLGDRWIDLRIPDYDRRPRSLRAARSVSVHDPRQGRTGKTLSMNDVRGREPFQSLFALMDRDADGKVTEAEMDAALDLLEDLSSSQAVFGVADRGEMLFGTLDADGDGRLGLRELLAARKRLASYDRDGDGRITAAEIPHRYDWVISPVPMHARDSPWLSTVNRCRRPPRHGPATAPPGSRRWTATATATSHPASSSAPATCSAGSTSTATG